MLAPASVSIITGLLQTRPPGARGWALAMTYPRRISCFEGHTTAYFRFLRWKTSYLRVRTKSVISAAKVHFCRYFRLAATSWSWDSRKRSPDIFTWTAIGIGAVFETLRTTVCC